MSYIKNYEVGNIHVDVPQKHFIYELPLFAFSDARDSLSVSLVYQSKMTDNPFYMANGFKLNLHKRLIMEDGAPVSYEDGNGNVVKLNWFGNKGAFDDGSYRFIRLINGNFVLENPDYSKEIFAWNGNILGVQDKYGRTILRYMYSSNMLSYVQYKRNRTIRFEYQEEVVRKIYYSCSNGTFTIGVAHTNNGMTVRNYSGVDYHITPTTNGLEAYSANAGEAFSSTFSQKVTAVTSGNTITLEKFLGTKKLDSTLYNFVHFDSEGKVDILDITNFQGVKTRMQFANGKPTYAYEIQTSATEPVAFVPYAYTYASTSATLPHYSGRVTYYNNNYYNNNEASGSQGYGDGLPMFCDTNTHYDDINRYVGLGAISGLVVLSGWLKAKGTATSCIVNIFADDVPRGPYIITGLVAGQWQYFTIPFFLEEEASSVRVETSEFTNVVEGCDFRLTGEAVPNQEIVEYKDNMTRSAGILIYTDTQGKEHMAPITDSVEYYNGNTMLGRETYHFTVKELLRFKVNQMLGTNTGEIYYDEGRGILPLIGALSVRYHTADGTYVNKSILDLAVGNMHTTNGNTYVTKTDFYTEADGSVRMRTRMSKNGVETKEEIYDEHLDLIQSTTYTKTTTGVQTAITTYTKTTNEETAKEIEAVTTVTSDGESIITSATYDANDFLESTTDEFDTITHYTTDARWGVVTNTEVTGVMGVSDTFDDDCTTLDTRTFGIDIPKDHRFSYENGILTSVTDGVLAYGFGYDESGLLSSVSKNGLSVEQIATTDNGKVVTTSYPAVASPLFTTTQRYDKYGRMTQMDGVVTNTYDVNPTQNMDTYRTAGVDNGSGKLATATDHLTGHVRKYAYRLNRLSRIAEFDAAGNKLNTETFLYDEYSRPKKDTYVYDVAGNKSVSRSYTYPTDTDGNYEGEAVETCTYMVNDLERLSTVNTYDVLGRLSRKGIVLGQAGFQRNYTYDKTRVHTIRDTWGLTNIGEDVYSYDVMGRVKSVSYTAKDGTNYYTTYAYDQYGQLVRENNQALAKTFVYEYNDIGNIVSIKEYPFNLSTTVGGTYTEKVFTYNATYPDRFNNCNGTLLYYNSMGYPASYGGKTCTWTKDKLTRLHRGNAMQPGTLYEDCVFTYDAYGRRLTKSYTYDPNPAVTSDTSYTYNITYDYDNSGRLIREYCTGAYTFNGGFSYTREFIYLYDENGIMGVLYSYNGAALKPYFFHKNLQGDVIAIYDETGKAVAEYAYDAWGNCTIKKSNGDLTNYNPIRYRGYYYDRETNLYFVGGRYYDPTCGRFISPDGTASFAPQSVNGMNLYLYAGNDPVNGVYGGANVGAGGSAGGATGVPFGASCHGAYSNSFNVFAGLNWSHLFSSDSLVNLGKDISISFGEIAGRVVWGLSKNGQAFSDFHYSAYGINGYTLFDNLPSITGKIFQGISIALMAYDVLEAGYYSYQSGHSLGQGVLNVGLTAGKNYLVYRASLAVTTAVGTWAGAKLGASLGSFAGPVGLIIGAVAGAGVGWLIDSFGDVLIDWIVGWFD